MILARRKQICFSSLSLPLPLHCSACVSLSVSLSLCLSCSLARSPASLLAWRFGSEEGPDPLELSRHACVRVRCRRETNWWPLRARCFGSGLHTVPAVQRGCRTLPSVSVSLTWIAMWWKTTLYSDTIECSDCVVSVLGAGLCKAVWGPFVHEMGFELPVKCNKARMPRRSVWAVWSQVRGLQRKGNTGCTELDTAVVT